MRSVDRVVIRSVITIRMFGSPVCEPLRFPGEGVPAPGNPRLLGSSRPVSCSVGADPRSLSMAKTSDVATSTAVLASADIERAAAFAREPFLLDGEGPEALAPGTARRRALDAALSEIGAGAEHPSIEWRRDFSLLLGLERFPADAPPHLLDRAELKPPAGRALSATPP